MKFQFKNYEIEIKDDNYYSSQSTHSSTKYTKEYSEGKTSKGRTFKINKRGIIIKDKQTGTEISSAIIYENGGRTEMNEEKYKIDGEYLWLCTGDSIYCLEIPTLKISWFNTSDIGTNYSINDFKDEVIIYGEFGALRLNKQGEIQWQFMGGDGIFKEGEGRFKINGNEIILVDENEKSYVIDENGNGI